MLIKKKNVARLSSLSALGAGALGVATGTAEASNINYTPVAPNVVVGPGPLGQWQFVQADFVTAPYSLFVQRNTRPYPFPGASGDQFVVNLIDKGASFLAKKGGTRATAEIVNYGAMWPATGALGKHTVKVASRIRSNSSFSSWTGLNLSFANKYALFEVQGASGPLYGWIELSNAVSANYPNGTGPEVTVQGWAYDTTGAKIAAGDTGAGGGAGVPEPSTMALTGLAALALGAAGLRRWRAARKLAS